MFYQESYNCTMYKTNGELVEKFDYFIANLIGDEANKITVSLIEEKLNIQRIIAKNLLLYFEKCNILKRMYAITCPNEECECVLKIVPAEKIIEAVDEICSMEWCFNCEKKVEQITEENIFILFERCKKSTASQEEIEKTLDKYGYNTVSEKANFFSKADSLEINDIYECYYRPDESAKKKLQTLYNNLGAEYTTTTEKGNVLENLVEEMFSLVKCFKVSKAYRTSTNQLDVTVKPLITICKPSVLDLLSPYFICECKNEKEIPGNTYYHKLYSILSSTEGKVGILFSINSCAHTCNTIAREKYLLDNIVLINITKMDLSKIISDKLNIFEVIKEKIDAVTLNSTSGLREIDLA